MADHSAWVNRVFDVLVEVFQVPETNREAFLSHWPDCREWRLFFATGIKVWFNPSSDRIIYVNCYPEEKTPELDALIELANKRLAPLAQQWLDETQARHPASRLKLR